MWQVTRLTLPIHGGKWEQEFLCFCEFPGRACFGGFDVMIDGKMEMDFGNGKRQIQVLCKLLLNRRVESSAD